MRPRFRSYGDSSTSTRSPGQDADEVLAHLARDVGQNLMLVLELHLTRNIALGSGSTTVASTSIASSFLDKRPSSLTSR